jgi:hypothetical protein
LKSESQFSRIIQNFEEYLRIKREFQKLSRDKTLPPTKLDPPRWAAKSKVGSP